MSLPEGEPTDGPAQSTAVAVATPAKPLRYGGMDEVQGGPFQQWMKDWCHWLVTTKPRPKVSQQTQKATELAGVVIHRRALSWLTSRKDVDAYLTLLSADGLARAKHKMLGDLEFYAELHRMGAEMALRAEDHRAIAAYTTPALDRILPKRQESVQQSSMVVVQVTGAQAEKLHADPEASRTELVVEAVVEEKV